MVRDLPAGDSFEVNLDPYEGINVEEIASEEAFRAAVNTMNAWKENLDEGVGEAGTHAQYRENGKEDTQYRNTGEAVDSITMDPQEPGHLEYEVGSNRVQVAVAEVGRSPGSPPPPFKPIADWAREKGIEPEGDQSFEAMVNAFRFAIAERGIPGFKPAKRAADAIGPEFERRTVERLNEEIEDE